MLDGYIRVSQVAGRSGDTFISPTLQRDQIESWALSRGETIGEIFEELDESGARSDRPLLMHAIKRIERGESSGLIVARLDRFGRSLRDGLAAIQRIRDANGVFVSVQDGLDLGTDTGKLVLHMLLSMGEWELDRLRTSWEIAKVTAIRRGVHVGSTTPFGYRRDPHSQLRVDPTAGPLIPELFKRRAAGSSIAELSHWLQSKGARTSRGNPYWLDTTVRGILANRVYMGELRAGKHVARGVHPALVDPGTWQRAQRPRSTEVPQTKTPTMLGGLVRCAGCRMVLHSQTVARNPGRRITEYACHGRSSQAVCTSAAYVTGPTVEPYVEQVFFGELFAKQRREPASSFRLEQLREELENAEDALEEYRDSPRIFQVLGESRFVSGLQVRKRRVDLLMQDVAREERRVDSVRLPRGSDMEDSWPSLTIRERRAAIAELIDCVFVTRGWSNIVERAFVCFRGEEPPDLPSRGAHRPVSIPFNPALLPSRRRPRLPPKWKRSKIQERLAVFLARRSFFPASDEFTISGHGPLYAQIMRDGGPEHWAVRMGVEKPRRRQGVRAWNSDLALMALRTFVRGRKSFPARRAFSDNGFRGLYNWLQRNGGIDFWAAEVDLPRS